MKKFYLFGVLLLLTGFQSFTQSVLLVDDNGQDVTRIAALRTSLDNLGYTYTYYNAVEQEASPSFELMEPFDLVIWYTGNDGSDLYFWNGDETDNEALKIYLDKGGMLWLQGLDFLFDRYGGAKDTFYMNDFVYDYLGIEEYVGQTNVDDGVNGNGLEYAEVAEDNGIFDLDSLVWVYATLWYADAILPVEDARALYYMAPLEYDFGGLPTAILNEKGDAKIMSFTVETGKFDAQWRLDSLFAQGLRYFKQFASTSNLVESITVSSANGDDFIEVKGGSLQMEAAVLPEEATNKNIQWTLENNEEFASISMDGLLTASGLSNGNGIVTVVATAVDGSGIKGTMDVSIKNQGDPEDYEILLVNDNANATDRYTALEDALRINDYDFLTYNTVLTGDFPGEDLIDDFDVVIWYTGNDGLDLKLWDQSDPMDIKFNAPLMSYLDKGGIVWLQGLDFFYDIFGQAPFPAGDDEFRPGSFFYDYMGIKKYVAQSKNDDGDLGVSQLDVVHGNIICAISPITWIYATLWYVDALEITDNAQGIYRLGPTDYVLSQYYAGVYNKMESTLGKLLSFTFDAALIDNQDNRAQLFREVLESFRSILAHNETLAITETDFIIYPNPASGKTSLSFDLQESATVRVSLTSILGAVSMELVDRQYPAGAHLIDVELADLPKGSYLVSIVINDRMTSKKLVVVK